MPPNLNNPRRQSILVPAAHLFDTTPILMGRSFTTVPTENDIQLVGFFTDEDLDELGGDALFAPVHGNLNTTDFGAPASV